MCTITKNNKDVGLVEKFKQLQTPFYYYDVELLRKTLNAVKIETDKYGYTVHYAIKANANQEVLKLIASYGLGADCVTGNEVLSAIAAGFPANKIVFAGVGKTDVEINIALDNDIFCFNVESIPELTIINELAVNKNKTATIAFRINPEVDAHTHSKITTGTAENKFGIALDCLDEAFNALRECKNIKFAGLHFHIGSQITDMSVYENLCNKVNEIQNMVIAKGFKSEIVNVGGGLGIDYETPKDNPIPNFEKYFEVFSENLALSYGQTVHFELGRSIVGQMGTLISQVVYVKEGVIKKFAILDAGMNDLVRPAMYDAHHEIENISSDNPDEVYDVVGPVCESSDVFAKNILLTETKRGDLIKIHSAGAYGRVMSSNYNLREFPKEYLSYNFNQ